MEVDDNNKNTETKINLFVLNLVRVKKKGCHH